MSVSKPLMSLGILLIVVMLTGFAVGYFSHKEYVPVKMIVTATETFTEIVNHTETVTEIKNITIVLYKQVDYVDVKIVSKGGVEATVYVTNKGNTTLKYALIYVRGFGKIFGPYEMTPTEIVVKELEPGVTRAYDITLPALSDTVYICLLVPQKM
jgi:hypothetical protein